MALDKKIPEPADWVMHFNGDLYTYVYDPWEETYVPFLKDVGILGFNKKFLYTLVPGKGVESDYTKQLFKVIKEVQTKKRKKDNVGPKPKIIIEKEKDESIQKEKR